MTGTSERVVSAPKTNCPRCSGFMVWSYSNEFEAGGGQHLRMLRCINCGELLEEQIVANRETGGEAERLKKSRARFRRRPLRG